MESGVPGDGGGSLIRHAAPGAIGALMVPVIEAPFRTALMAGVGGLHRAAARQNTTACRAVGVATVARRTDREEAVAPAEVFWRRGWSTVSESAWRPPTG